MKRNGNNNRAFTLIELMIVMAMIAILISVSIVALRQLQARGRDTRRKADLNKTKNGLISFYNTYKVFPNPGMNSSTGGVNASFGDYNNFKCSTYNDLQISGFESVNKCLRYLGYMDKLTQDNLAATNNNYKYRYVVLDDTANWEISAVLENGNREMSSDCTSTPTDTQCDSNRYELGSLVNKVNTSGSGETTYSYCTEFDDAGLCVAGKQLSGIYTTR